MFKWEMSERLIRSRHCNEEFIDFMPLNLLGKASIDDDSKSGDLPIIV